MNDDERQRRADEILEEVRKLSAGVVKPIPKRIVPKQPEVVHVVRPQELGGIARAKALTPERRHEIAQMAAKTRWQKALDCSRGLKL